MAKVQCVFTIGEGWYWQSGPPVGGQHDQLQPNTIGNTLTYIIEIPNESDYWYVLPLAVYPNSSFGYGFVQYKDGVVNCKVEAPSSWSPRIGKGSVSYGDLTITTSILHY